MKKLILFCLLFSGIWSLPAQDKVWHPWYVWYSWSVPPDSASTPDSTLIPLITNSTDNGQDSIDVTGSINYSSLVDSTYWLINRENIPVTWANIDSIAKTDGWQSTATLAHGQTGNDTVYIGLAVKDLSGDTTAIVNRQHIITAYTNDALNWALNHILY